MAAVLPNPSAFALSVAIGSYQCILKPLLDFLEGPAAGRNPVMKAAVAAVILTLAVAYFVAVVLFHFNFAPWAAAPVSPAILWRFVCVFFALVFSLIFFVVVPLMAVLLHFADGR